MCTHCYSGNIIDPPKVRTQSHQTPALKRRHSNLYMQVDINMSKSCTCMCMSGCVSPLIYLCAIASMSVCGWCKKGNYKIHLFTLSLYLLMLSDSMSGDLLSSKCNKFRTINALAITTRGSRESAERGS